MGTKKSRMNRMSIDMKRNARLLCNDQPPAHYQGGNDLLSTEPLWLQAQAAQQLGTAHGQACIPEDLREAYAMQTWPGSPELRKIYCATADKSILAVARFLARQEITDTCDRIGGIRTDPDTGELTSSSADLLEHEYVRSQKEHACAIDHGPDRSRIRFH
jgi:hypothetical protein